MAQFSKHSSIEIEVFKRSNPCSSFRWRGNGTLPGKPGTPGSSKTPQAPRQTRQTTWSSLQPVMSGKIVVYQLEHMRKNLRLGRDLWSFTFVKQSKLSTMNVRLVSDENGFTRFGQRRMCGSSNSSRLGNLSANVWMSFPSRYLLK